MNPAGNPSVREVRAIRVLPETLTVDDGDTTRLVATLFDQTGAVFATAPATARLVWGSSFPAIASVDSGGLVSGQRPGAAQVTASVLGADIPLSLATQVLVRAVPAALAAVSGDSQTAAVGTRLPQDLLVKVTDRHGDGVPGVMVTFAVSAGRGTLGANSAVTDATGMGSAALTLDTLVGSSVVQARAARLPQALVQFHAQGRPGAVTKLTIVSGDAQGALTGAALTAPLVVRASDRYNNAAPGVAVSWQVTAGGGSVAPATGVTDTFGLAQATWTLGATPGAQSARATAGAALIAGFAAAARSRVASVAVTPASASVGLDLTSTFTAMPLDGAGNPLAGRQVTWSSSDPLKATIDAAGVLTARGMGTVTVTATVEGVSGAATVTVTPGAISPTTSVVSVSAATVASGSAVTLAVHGRDAHGNPVVIGGHVVAFTASGGTSTGTIGATADSGNGVYVASFTGVHAGTATTIGATIDGVAVTGTLPTLTVTPGAAAVLAFSGQPAGAAAGAALTVVLTALDAQGNVATGFTGTVGVALTAGAGPAGAHLLGTTGVAAVAGVATFAGLNVDSVGAGYTLTASASGLTGATSGAFAITAGTAAPARSVVTVARVTVASGDTVTVSLRARDGFGNALTSGGLTVVFAASGGTSTGAFGTTTDHGNGTYTAVFTGAVAGTAATIGATIGGAAVTSTLPALTVTPGAAAASQAVVTVARATVASGDTVTVALRARDAQGNALPSGGLTVAFSASGGTSTGTFGAVSDHGNGVYVASFTGMHAGTATAIGATIDGVAVTTPAPTVTVTPGDASQLTFTTQPAGAAAGVGFGAAVTAFDAQGNAATAFAGTVALALTAGTGRAGAHLLGTTSVAASAGVATFTGLSLDSAGAGYTLTASAAGLPGATSAAFAVGAGAVSLARTAVSVARGTVASGDTVTVTLRTRDGFGNALTTGGLTVAFAASGGTSTGTFGAVTDHADGSYSATLTGVVAGTPATIGATIGGAAVTSTLPALTVTPGAAAASQAVVTVARATVASGDTVTVALRARDAQGNALPSGGLTVAFSASGGTSTGTFGAVSDHGNGTYTAILTGALAGTATTVHATINTTAVTGTLPAVTVTPGAASAAQSTVTVARATIALGDTVTVALRVRDAAGNALATGGLAVVFSTSGGTSQGTIGTTTDHGNGTYSALFTGTVGGTGLTVGATIGGMPVSSTAPTVTVIAPVSIAGVPLTAGVAHACEIRTGGAVWCWGSNAAGQLGDGTTNSALMPVAVSGGLAFAAVSAGDDHTCALTSTGAAYCWGGNAAGQLGIGGTSPSYAPTAVAGGITFAQIAAGSGFTCGVAAAGTVYCWGNNGNGKLGNDNAVANAPTPVAVSGSLVFSSVALFANNHACGLTLDGKAYCWGYNFDGELGDGTQTDRTVPTAVVGGLTFSAIAGATYHSCALVAGGSAYCWGDNNVSQLGFGSPPTDSWSPGAVQGGYSFASLVAGGNHTCGLLANGTAVCWGYNYEGALGDSTNVTRLAPAPAAGGHSYVNIAAGDNFTCGKTASGTTWCWGRNTSGQIGDGTTSQRLVPVQVGVASPVASVTVAPATSNLPVAGTLQLVATPQDVGGNALTGRAVSWASSDPTVATVDANGLVLGVAVGVATITATSEGVSGTAIINVMAAVALTYPGVVSAGYQHACDVRPDLTLNCWGYNDRGRLGNGNNTNQTAPVQVASALQFFQVAAGYDHTCALAADSTAYCWGPSYSGQGGNGSIYGSYTPFPVQGGLHFAQIIAGAQTTCARTAAGAVYCWGADFYSDRLSPVRLSQLPPLTTISTTQSHVCGLTASGQGYCWGSASQGQLGDGHPYFGSWTSPSAGDSVVGGLTFVSIAAGEIHSCGVATGGAAYCWGNNSYSQLGRTTVGLADPTPGLVGGGLAFASIYAGYDHSCGLLPDGTAYCWGTGTHGQLGNNDRVTVQSPVPVSGGLRFSVLALGAMYSCGRTLAGQVYCWGLNQSGQLGVGSTVEWPSPQLVH